MRRTDDTRGYAHCVDHAARLPCVPCLQPSRTMAPSEDVAPPAETSVAVPAMMGFCGIGVGAIGFGAGYGARSYFNTAAYKELLEKFPEAPTPEAERLARSGATRAFLGGTALAACMGIGAVVTARMYGIRSAQDLGDEIRKWLPTAAHLEVRRARCSGTVARAFLVLAHTSTSSVACTRAP